VKDGQSISLKGKADTGSAHKQDLKMPITMRLKMPLFDGVLVPVLLRFSRRDTRREKRTATDEDRIYLPSW
jgi:hypothetical protein